MKGGEEGSGGSAGGPVSSSWCAGRVFIRPTPQYMDCQLANLAMMADNSESNQGQRGGETREQEGRRFRFTGNAESVGVKLSKVIVQSS